MKIAIAQIQSAKGDIEENISKHIRFIRMAIDTIASAIFFPELSLTGYEPELAQELATTSDDMRLSVFQTISDENSIAIGVGLPVKSSQGVRISMIVFQPFLPRYTYAKQYLHDDELPYFIPGREQGSLVIENIRIALAICYESLLPHHAQTASREGMDVYLTSVAKSANGVAKAYRHYPLMAGTYSVPVLMANCVGYCDNFQSAGASAVWNKKGKLVEKLDDKREGLLIFDTETEQCIPILNPDNAEV